MHCFKTVFNPNLDTAVIRVSEMGKNCDLYAYMRYNCTAGCKVIGISTCNFRNRTRTEGVGCTIYPEIIHIASTCKELILGLYDAYLETLIKIFATTANSLMILKL